MSLYVEPPTASPAVDWPALEFHDVFKIYRSGPVETVALRGFDLRVDREEFVALLGPSGCGKSTVLSLAAALDEPSAGEVRAFGRSLGRLEERERAAYRASAVALVFQSDNLWRALSARENAVVSLRIAGRRNAGAAAAEALATFGVGARADHRVAALSGGEQQRVAVASAAARHARIVLADEPTGELDEANERVVIEALERLRSAYACTVVVVTHSDQVAASADRVVEMRDGRTVA